MPEKTFTKGFTGAFTWDNVGMQVANGLVSGGASFAMNMLLKSLTEQNTNMSEMFQKFADQIVDRLSIKMKAVVAEAFYQQNFGELKTESAAMESEYRAFLIAHSINLLNHLEEISFLIDQKAVEMGIPAIGIYCTEKTIQISIFKEKAKLNIHYKKLIKEKIKEAKLHIEKLRKSAIEKIIESLTFKKITQYQDGEIDAIGYLINYDGKTIDHVLEFSSGELTGEDFKSVYAFHKEQKIAEFDKQIYFPAKAIIDRL